MQQRRFRPGDVLDDYCPRERRITDHAIVAMIDDHIKQTRCVVCDAEHEYKEGKVPPQRRKRPQAALFSQVLEGLQGPQRTARRANHDSGGEHEETLEQGDDVAPESPGAESGNGNREVTLATPVVSPVTTEFETPAASAHPNVGSLEASEDGAPVRDEGPVRRSLIRATLPRAEGQPVPTRAMPEFTIRQPTNGRGGQRAGGRRRGGHHQGQGGQGQTRFGRDGQGGQGQGQKHHGGRRHGSSRRGGKKR